MTQSHTNIVPAIASELSFWQEYLKSTPVQLQLPVSQPRPAELSGETVSETFALPEHFSSAIQQFCAQQHIQPNIFFLGSFKLLLWKYAGQNNVSVGVSHKDNNTANKELTPCQNTVSGATHIAQWFSQVSTSFQESEQHSTISLDRIIKAIGFHPIRNIHPLFQFSYQHVEDGVSTSDSDNELATYKNQPIDLSLRTWGMSQFHCTFLFSADLFTSPEMNAIRDHFIKILEWVVTNRDPKLEDLTFLTETDLSLIQQINATNRPDFLNRTFLELFAQCVATNPAKEAVYSNDKQLTYHKLNRASDVLAVLLTDHGIRQGQFVGVLVSRGLESLVALIGIMKAGGTYVPLDPSAPTERLRYIINDSGLKYLIVDETTAESELFRDTELTPIHISVNILLGYENEPVPPTAPMATDIAYMIYTSGSTGRPKGVPVQHESLANFLLTTAETPGIKNDDVVIALGSTAFDISLPEMLLPIVNGASLVIAPQEALQDGQSLADLLDKRDVTYMLATPATWSILFESGWSGKHDLKMLSAGDVLSEHLIKKMLRTGAEVWNGYGTTETTIMSSYYKIATPATEPFIGRPIANTGYYVLDEFDNIMPPGIIGELAISGVGLSPGYHKRASLTDKAFTLLSCAEEKGTTRIYKTGDLVQLTHSGDFRYLGRADNQVKIRGYRIELGEIEAQCASHPEITDCCCTVLTYSEIDKRIIAYYRAAQPLASGEIRAFLSAKIPAYMIPVVFMYMENFPKNQNQKVDRNALPLPDRNDFSRFDDVVDPEGNVEETVLSIWQQVLQHEGFGVTDNFFDLGGYSLIATQIIMQVQSELGKTVGLSVFYAQPTVREFCRILDDIAPSVVAEADSISHGIHKQWRLSPQQERLWFFRELSPESAAYNVAQCLVVEGELSLDLINKAVCQVVACHESLNCRIDSDGIEGIRLSLAQDELDVTITHLTSPDQDIELQQSLIEKTKVATDFFARTCSVTLYVYNDKKVVVAVFLPHLFTDGVSFALFQKQFLQVYANLREGRDALAGITVPFQYSDYVHWLTHTPPQDNPEAVSFWSTYLTDIPEQIQLPYTYSRPSALTYEGDAVLFSLSPELSTQVKELCFDLQITPFVFLLANYFLLLWKYSGQNTVVVGAPHANRTQEEMQDIIGFFVDMLPVRGDIDSSLTVAEWFATVNSSFISGYDHAQVGFSEIVETVEHRRQLNSHPLFQVIFAYQDFGEHLLGHADIVTKEMFVNRGLAEYDLALYAWEDSGFHGAFEFSTELFDRQTITKLQARFTSIISWSLKSKNATLSELSLVTEKDWAFIQKSNQTNRPEFLNRTCLDAFSASAKAHPNKEAVRFNNTGISYKQLEMEANNLAVTLNQKGVGRGSLVGVLVERSLATEIALLGVLKSGATYIPLDPDFPIDRLRYIVEDSALEFIVVDDDNKDMALLQSSSVTAIHLGGLSSSGTVQHKVVVPPVADDIAYIIYTSGSTGRPKGVPVQHESLANFLLTTAETPGIRNDDVVIALGSTSFDISLPEMLLPIVNGASLVIAPHEALQDGQSLADLLDKRDVTYMLATPVTWSILFESGWSGKHDLKMLSAGDILSEHLIKKMLRTGAEVWNGYGTTETTIMSSYYKIATPATEPFIGRPIANTGYYVLDEFDNIMPPGIIGELAISGVGLSPGYHKRASLTDKAFTLLSCAEENSTTRIYKTGDLVQSTHSGDLRYLGRADNQVKIRGFRIELGEIETQLASYLGITDCCVIVIGDGDKKKIVAYYISESVFSRHDLHTYLKSKLPSYMIPAVFVSLDEFPKTPNQKIDRKALPLPDPKCFNDDHDIIAPATELEHKLLQIWQELLEIQNLSVTDNFFDSGGTSLSAISLIGEINKGFSTEIPLINCFQYPTIRSFANYLGELLDEASCQIYRFKNLIDITPTGDKVPFVLVHGDAANDFLPKGLGENQPFYGYIHQGADGKRMASEKVADIAQHYLQELQRIRPHGPYILSGFSFGGLVALHIAYLLEQKGEDVRGLVLFDTFHPLVVYNHTWKESPVRRLKNIVRYSLDILRSIKTCLVTNYYFSKGSLLPAAFRSVYIMDIYRLASKGYRPPGISCPVTLLRSESDVTMAPANGWGGITTGPLHVENVPGDHLGMIRDAINQNLLREKLVETIAKWQ